VGSLYRGVLPAALRPQALIMYAGNEWCKHAVGLCRLHPACVCVRQQSGLRLFHPLHLKSDVLVSTLAPEK
jgi:hypothetical protein